MKHCNNCGKEFSEIYDFCPECGSVYSEGENGEKALNKRSPSGAGESGSPATLTKETDGTDASPAGSAEGTPSSDAPGKDASQGIPPFTPPPAPAYGAPSYTPEPAKSPGGRGKTVGLIVSGVAVVALLITTIVGFSSANNVSAALGQREKELSTLQGDYSKLKKDYAALEEKMKPFEKMTAAQAEAETIRAQQEKAAAEEAAAAKKAEEEAARAAEEAKGYETGITYNQLARTPNDFKGKKVKFKGKVLQVIEEGATTSLRLAVNGDYNSVLYCTYNSSSVPSRVLDGDTVTIMGVSKGLFSYKSTGSGTITIPAVSVDQLAQ